LARSWPGGAPGAGRGRSQRSDPGREIRVDSKRGSPATSFRLLLRPCWY
jgi:hypothetical protein